MIRYKRLRCFAPTSWSLSTEQVVGFFRNHWSGLSEYAILSIDGVPLRANKMVKVGEELLLYSHLISMKQIGENVTFEIIRDGKKQSIQLLRGRSPHSEYLTVPRQAHIWSTNRVPRARYINPGCIGT